MLSRLRVPIFCSSLLLVAAIVSAETIRFDPPNPTGTRSVDAIITGVWRDACTPSVKNVAISGQTVTLHLDATVPPGVACAQSTSPYTRTFHMGILPPAGYTVILVADAGSTSTELARVPLIVRDAETLSISPYAVPTSGGPIGLANPFFLTAATLTIGGVTVPANSDVDGSLFANAPPHAPGVVDVSVNATTGTVTSQAALIYYDPAAADPAVFEPILFPLSFQGPGAFGSQWTTESFLYSNSSAAYFRDPLPCAGCSASIDIGMKQLTNDANPWGHLLYAMRGTTSSVDFASRVRDNSRQALTAGTDVPVARERDFRGQLRLLNVPVDSRYRVMLRLWSLGDYPQFIVNVDSLALDVAPLSVTRIPATAMWFGSIDVTSLVSKGHQSHERVGLPVRVRHVLWVASVSSDLGNAEHHQQRHATGNDRFAAIGCEMDFNVDEATPIADFFLTLREEEEGGLHIEMMSRSKGHLAGFPAWDHADRDLRHFTPDDIPLGEEEPFEDAGEAWRIVIIARGKDVFVLEGDAPRGPLPRRYRIPRDQYLTAWNELMVRYHPPLALEDVLGGGESESVS